MASRRGFLSALGLGAAGAFTPRFLVYEPELMLTPGDSLVPMEWIAQEALRVFESRLGRSKFVGSRYRLGDEALGRAIRNRYVELILPVGSAQEVRSRYIEPAGELLADHARALGMTTFAEPDLGLESRGAIARSPRAAIRCSVTRSFVADESVMRFDILGA